MTYTHQSRRTSRHPAGESKKPPLRVDFDRRLKLEFHGSKITSDGGFLAYRELDDALGLTEVAGAVFQDSRTGKNGWHGMTGQFRQSLFGRVGGYEDVNDAERLGHGPAMRWIVGGKAVERQAASSSQMGRFETEVLQQRGPAPASCPGVQPRQLHADFGFTRRGGTLVVDHDPREAGQDRGQGRRSWPVRHIPNGGGRRTPRSVQRHPGTDRQTATTDPGDGLNEGNMR